MIITCPECATRYHLDPAALPPIGRMVRCASCGHRWQARPPADTPMLVEASVQPPPAEPLALKRPAAPPGSARRGSWTGVLGWVAGVCLVLMAASAILGREEIVAAFPASAEIYQKVGLDVHTGFGLEFADVTSQRLAERGVAILVVEGRIVNISGRRHAVPPVRLTLLDGGGRALQEELLRPEVEMLAEDGATRFTGRVVDPVDQARNFSVTFDVDSY